MAKSIKIEHTHISVFIVNDSYHFVGDTINLAYELFYNLT